MRVGPVVELVVHCVPLGVRAHPFHGSTLGGGYPVRYPDHHSYTDPEHPEIKHIDFVFKPDFETKTISGIAEYELEAPALHTFYLDTKNLQIDYAQTDGTAIAWELGEPDLVLGQRLKLGGMEGKSRFELGFRTHPEAPALQWLTPEQTMGEEKPYLYSQCQPINARSIFPCQDSPSVRFTYTAELIVPYGLSGLMAAALVEVEEKNSELSFHFHMPQTIPAYLFALAVGKISHHDISSRVRIYAEPELLQASSWEFGNTEELVTEAVKLYGPYDWERYDLLVMPPSFPFGAMENPRLTFISPTTITGDRSHVLTVAHELAHSWTGNLVTCATWEDLWLNEGWTTYAEQRIIESIEGPEIASMVAAYNQRKMLEDMERIGYDSPHTVLKPELKGRDPEGAAPLVPYRKGFAFLRRIEECVGREEFDRFTHKYIGKHRFTSVDTMEFLDFLNNELPTVQEQIDINEWVYGTGFPVDAPVIETNMLADIDQLIVAYERGLKPDLVQVEGWSTFQRMLFLQSLPIKMSVDDCIYFENLFDLKNSRDKHLQSEFYKRAINSGYREILPDIVSFLNTVGRGLLILPVWRALASTEWSKALVDNLYQQCKTRLHPMMNQVLEKMLSHTYQ